MVVAVEPVGAGGGDGGDRLGRQVAKPVLLAHVEMVIGAAARAAHRVERVAVLEVGAGPGRDRPRGNPVVGVGKALGVAELVVGRARVDVPIHPHLRSGELCLPAEGVGGHPLEEDDPAVVLVRVEGAGAAVGRVVGLGQHGGVGLQLAGRGRGGVVEGLVARHPQDAGEDGEREGGAAVGGGGEERRDLRVGGLDLRGGGDRARVVREIHLHPEHALRAEDPRRVRGGRRDPGARHIRALPRLRGQQRLTPGLEGGGAGENLHLAAHADRERVRREAAGRLLVVVEGAPGLRREGGDVVEGEAVQGHAVLGGEGEAAAVGVGGEAAVADDRHAPQAVGRRRAGDGDLPVTADVEQLLQFRGDSGRQAGAEARGHGGGEGRGGIARDQVTQLGATVAGERTTPGGERGRRPRIGAAPVGQPLGEGRHGGGGRRRRRRNGRGHRGRGHGERRGARALPGGGRLDWARGTGRLDAARGGGRLAGPCGGLGGVAGEGPRRGEEECAGGEGADAGGGHRRKRVDGSLRWRAAMANPPSRHGRKVDPGATPASYSPPHA